MLNLILGRMEMDFRGCIKKLVLKDSCSLMVVLKSDAYGNGIEYLGKVAEFAGVDYIGITENKEILKLRKLLSEFRVDADWIIHMGVLNRKDIILLGKNNGLPPNIEYALVKGRKVRVVGALSMNATMIDITPIYELVKNGDQVVFIGRQENEEITAEEIWKATGVVPWTLHCNVGQLNYDARYPKKLIDN